MISTYKSKKALILLIIKTEIITYWSKWRWPKCPTINILGSDFGGNWIRQIATCLKFMQFSEIYLQDQTTPKYFVSICMKILQKVLPAFSDFLRFNFINWNYNLILGTFYIAQRVVKYGLTIGQTMANTRPVMQ